MALDLCHEYCITMSSYVGDEHGLVSVIKFEAEEGEISRSPYHVSAKSLRGNLLLSLLLMIDNQHIRCISESSSINVTVFL